MLTAMVEAAKCCPVLRGSKHPWEAKNPTLKMEGLTLPITVNMKNLEEQSRQ